MYSISYSLAWTVNSRFLYTKSPTHLKCPHLIFSFPRPRLHLRLMTIDAKEKKHEFWYDRSGSISRAKDGTWISSRTTYESVSDLIQFGLFTLIWVTSACYTNVPSVQFTNCWTWITSGSWVILTCRFSIHQSPLPSIPQPPFLPSHLPDTTSST